MNTITDWKTSDGIDIFARFHEPISAKPPRAAVLLTHGWGDHQGRYADLIDFFVSNQIAVLAHDLRGHGRSSGKRGYSPSFAALLDDLHLAFQQLGKLVDSDLPLFLYAQSFGGLLNLNYLIRNRKVLGEDKQLAGAIITSPMLGIEMKIPRWKLVAGKVAAFLMPRLTLKAGIDISNLSQNPEHAGTVASDPLRQGRISAKVFFDMLEAMPWTLNQAHQLPCPVLLMHGDSDKITSCQKSRQFADRSKAQVTLQIWPGMYHELHSEMEKQQVFERVQSWILNKLPV